VGRPLFTHAPSLFLGWRLVRFRSCAVRFGRRGTVLGSVRQAFRGSPGRSSVSPFRSCYAPFPSNVLSFRLSSRFKRQASVPSGVFSCGWAVLTQFTPLGGEFRLLVLRPPCGRLTHSWLTCHGVGSAFWVRCASSGCFGWLLLFRFGWLWFVGVPFLPFSLPLPSWL
jgi:hypothetical protein